MATMSQKIVKNLDFYDCKDFLDMAVLLSLQNLYYKFLNNFPIAEGLNIPRLLESCPDYPAAQPHGDNAFNFYFQVHFENLFRHLTKLRVIMLSLKKFFSNICKSFIYEIFKLIYGKIKSVYKNRTPTKSMMKK